MEFRDSASKHGISQTDALHAIEQAMVYVEQHYSDDSRMLILGPDRSGRMLEIVVIPARDPQCMIHADQRKPKFFELLRRGGRHS